MAKKVKMTDEYRAIRALDLLMRTIGLETYVDGSITYEDEDECTLETVKIDGYVCKYPGTPTDRNEISLDIYNNPKFAVKLFLFYIAKMGYQINIMYLTNTKPDTLGRFEVEFANGVKYTSHVYTKDSLKYIDMVMALENVFPAEYEQLKEIDIQ